jgi:hypothetical protein
LASSALILLMSMPPDAVIGTATGLQPDSVAPIA